MILILFLMLLTAVTFGAIWLLLVWLIRCLLRYFSDMETIGHSTAKRVELVFKTLLIAGALYIVIDAVFPSEQFYKDEFRTVTFREIPDSATFISKDASYPDTHGDYCSSARIELSGVDFLKLKNELEHDKRFTKDNSGYGSDAYDRTHDGIGKQEIETKFVQETASEDLYRNIEFHVDGRTVFINLCRT